MGNINRKLLYNCLNNDLISASECLNKGADINAKFYTTEELDLKNVQYCEISEKKDKKFWYEYDILEILFLRRNGNYANTVEFLLEKGIIAKKSSNIDLNNEKLLNLCLANKLPFNFTHNEYDEKILEKIFNTKRIVIETNYLLKCLNNNISDHLLDLMLENKVNVDSEILLHAKNYPQLLKKTENLTILCNALHKFLLKSEFEACNSILARIQELNLSYEHDAKFFFSLLIRDDYKMVEYAVQKLKYDPNRNYVYITWDGRNTYIPILLCADKSYINSIEALLNNGGNIEFTDSDGKSLLELAGADAKLIQLLLQRGAKFVHELTPSNFVKAITEKDFDTVLSMIKRGVNYQVTINNKTPLHYALETKDEKMVDIITRLNLGMDMSEYEETSYENSSQELSEDEGLPIKVMPSAPIPVCNDVRNSEIFNQ